MHRRFLCICLLFLACAAGRPLHAQLAGAEQQRLADGLYARGHFDLALTEYQKLIDAQPPAENRDLLHYRAGECAVQLNQREKAVAYFEKAVALGGKSLPAQRAQYRLADLAYRKGDLAEAEKLLRTLQAAEVDASIDAPLRFTLAQILESRSQPAEALRIYEGLLRTYPDESLSAYAALRVAALSGGGVEEKRKYYQQALKNPPTRDFEIEALWELARLESTARNHEAAADVYWRMWKNFPDSTRVRGSMIHLAWAQLQAEKFDRALALSEATSENRKAADADTWLYLDAVSHLQQGGKEQAHRHFELLLEKHPQSRFRSAAVYEVAGKYAADGEHAKVLPYAQDLQQVPGRAVEGLWLLAESSRGAGENRQAMQIYTRIAHQYPKHERAPDALYFKAGLLIDAGDPAVAAAALEDFQRRYPEDPRAFQALEQAGDLLVKAGKLQSGLEKWLAVLKANPEADPQLAFKCAMLEIRLEKFTDALGRLDGYLAVEVPEERRAEALYWKGVLLDRQGEDETAREALEGALRGELKADLQTPARMRLGQSYTRSGQPEKALEAFLPLLGTPREAELSDSLLLWLLPVSEKVERGNARIQIAKAMIRDARKAATRELGYYALAEAQAGQGKRQEAEKAWQAGLAFDSGTLESAQAKLRYADFLLAGKNYDAAYVRYGEAAALASALEQGRLQAEGMMGSGRVRMAQEQWEQAARYFMGVAVLFDDEALSPEALRLAAESFRRAGRVSKAVAAEKELNTRYPPPATPEP